MDEPLKMEMSENLNGLTTGEIVAKDDTAEQLNTVVHNGYLDKQQTKVNGDHSSHVDNSSSNQNGGMERSEEENINKVNQDENNLKDHDFDITKEGLLVEEDMDNSTATSNISDISAYEDSEKSMDVGETKIDQEEVEKEKCNEEEDSCSSKTAEPVNHDNHKPENDNSNVEKGDSVTEEMDIDSGETTSVESKIVESKTEVGENIGNGTKLGENEENSDSLCDDVKEKQMDEDMEQEHSDTECVKSSVEYMKKNDDLVSATTSDNDKPVQEPKSSTNSEIRSEDDTSATDEKTKPQEITIDSEITKPVEKSDDGEKTRSPEKCDDKDDKQTSLKSVEKVTDIDGSEILITINEENEESDGEEEKSNKGEKEEYDGKEENSNKGEKEATKMMDTEIVKPESDKKSEKKDSAEVVVVNDSPDKKPEIAPKVSAVSQPQTSVMNVKPGHIMQPPAGPPIRFPIMSGPPMQYYVPSTIQTLPNTQQKYINVNGQQILITLPVSSIGQVANTSVFATAGNSLIGTNPLSNVNMFATFPPPNPNKSPLDKTLDLDVPQASWEQKELIKYEVMSRKPDNAFWGGLANVSKKAELSSVGKFLFDLGSDIVKESAYEQIVQVQKKKEDANMLNDTEKESLQRMKKVVEELKDKLKYLHDLPKTKCSCGFTTESANVMFLHKQYPHTLSVFDKFNTLNCAYCSESFQGKFAEDFYKAHLAKEHLAMARFYSKPSFWPCNLCPFEGTNKNAIVKHKVKCLKNFKQHLNQAPHHVDINLSLKNIFYKFQVNNKKIQQAQIAAVDRPDTRSNKLPIVPNKPVIQNKPSIQPKPNMTKVRPPVVNPHRPIIPTQFQAAVSGVSPGNSWHDNFSRIVNTSVERPRYAQIQRPPPPLKPATVNKPTVNQLLRTQQTSSATNRTGFEVCEICGGYVKDRMSLRIHFFYAHKIEMPAHVFSKPLAPLFCNTCNERFWTSQGFAKHKSSVKHLQNTKRLESVTNQCWICLQKPENLYSHVHKFHRLTTGECMALKRCMFCGILSQNRKELELHMAATHGVLIKGDENKANSSANVPPQSVGQVKSIVPSNVSTKNLSTVVTGGSSGMVRNNFCVFCSAQFPDNTKLTLHCLSVHSTCKKCGMVVNKAADLVRHVCKMSSKTCSICGMKNLKPAGLIKHLETHTKPCRVVLKRLSQSQIDYATGGKQRKIDSRLRPRSSCPKVMTVDIKRGTHDSRQSEKKPLTVALKFDKGKGKNKKSIITLDDKSDNEMDEVIIESDDDSDVIIQEEEKTEIVLDSENEDDKSENKKKVDKSENANKTCKSESETKENKENEKKINKSENANKTCKSESENKQKQENEVDQTERERRSDRSESDEVKGNLESKKSNNKESEDQNEPVEDGSDSKMVESDTKTKQMENDKDESKITSEGSNDSSDVAREAKNSKSGKDKKVSDTSSEKSRKRSHSDGDDNSDIEEDKKRRKTEDESDDD